MKKLFLSFVIFCLAIPIWGSDLLILEEIQKAIATDFKLEGKTVVKVSNDMPQGRSKVEEMLEKNRKKVKELKTLKGSDEHNSDWISKKRQELSQWQQNREEQISGWEKERQATITKWISERQKYLKRVDQYKADIVSLPAPKLKNEKITMVKKETIPPLSDYKIIPMAFAGEAKDQGQRPTCASFATVRGLEILLARKEKYQELSEQYFFWASIPKCQKSPCPKQGSWPIPGLEKSKKSHLPDIPLANDCPYQSLPIENNVVQIPLSDGCNQGKIKVKKYSLKSSIAEIISAINSNYPVIGAFRLSENFYYNKGYVFIKDVKEREKKVDQHAEGHAILLVGLISLPQELHDKEGRFCLLAANSWGLGWGKGGHACLSEKWVEKYRFATPFMSIEEISL